MHLDKLSNSILFCVTTPGQSLSTSCQLAAINSQMCLLESPGGLITLDVAPINWLRKFHKRIWLFMVFFKPRCEAFLFVYCILWCLSFFLFFNFLHNTHVTEGRHEQGLTGASLLGGISHYPRWWFEKESNIIFRWARVRCFQEM